MTIRATTTRAALFWAAFTLSVLSVAVVLLRLPRELKV